MTDLPTQFNERVRPDIVKRANLSIKSKKRQDYGS
ncbi:MAG: 50S ribosomal protein L4, partial [Nanohaloarchaea archaeon SW_7_46_7]